MQLVRRTTAVLTRLGASPGMTMQELATALDVPLPSLHRLLGVLSEEEFVLRSDDRRYALGPAALALAHGTRPLDDVARPHMRRLADLFGETVFLTQLIGRRAVCTALVPGRRALRLFVAVGQEMPFHAAASARVMLADRTPEEVAELTGNPPLPVFTPGTPATPDTIATHLERVRVTGFDVCRDELDPNVLAVSAPIRLATGEIGASLTVAAPNDRHDGADGIWGAELTRVTAAISREIGWSAALPATP